MFLSNVCSDTGVVRSGSELWYNRGSLPGFGEVRFFILKVCMYVCKNMHLASEVRVTGMTHVARCSLLGACS